MKTFKRYYLTAWMVLGMAVAGVMGTAWLNAQENSADTGGGLPASSAHGELKAPSTPGSTGKDAIFYAIAFTMSVSCLAAAYAVAHVGAAALGVVSEKPELMGRVLIFVGLAEGIAIYGLIVAIMLIGKL